MRLQATLRWDEVSQFIVAIVNSSLNYKLPIPERVVEALWGDNYAAGFHINIRIVASDRNGLLRDITTVLANEKVSVLGVSNRADTKNKWQRWIWKLN